MIIKHTHAHAHTRTHTCSLSELGIEANYLNRIKDLHEKPTANIIPSVKDGKLFLEAQGQAR